MALKPRVKLKEEVPQEHLPFYVERGGAWVLDVEGGLGDPAAVEELQRVSKAKLDEFRAANIALRKQVEDLNARFEGIDPDEVRKLAEEKRRLEEQQALKAGEFEKVLDARLKTLKGEHDKALAALTGERDALNARLATIQIDQAVVTEATKRGLRPTALPDITARARHTFRLVNGVPQAFESDGKTPRAGRDGVTPLSLAEWLDTQVSDAPHLFASSAGGGATGDGSGGVGGQRSVSNPFRKASWNLTEQMKLLKSDPQLAARLKAAA
jgi:hypothetical protein